MKISELYTIGEPSQSFDGRSEFLDWNNCKIEKMSINEDYVLLHLKRDSDGEEGSAYLRVKDYLKSRKAIFLGFAFTDSRLIGLTLNELRDFETNITPENINNF
jgi:hypothetical protein